MRRCKCADCLREMYHARSGDTRLLGQTVLETCDTLTVRQYKVGGVRKLWDIPPPPPPPPSTPPALIFIIVELSQLYFLLRENIKVKKESVWCWYERVGGGERCVSVSELPVRTMKARPWPALVTSQPLTNHHLSPDRGQRREVLRLILVLSSNLIILFWRVSEVLTIVCGKQQVTPTAARGETEQRLSLGWAVHTMNSFREFLWGYHLLVRGITNLQFDQVMYDNGDGDR